jgi:N-methylhydantoinase A/oxoprolinase/acetone carboxylase beta subunit
VDAPAVLGLVKSLLERGVRRVCISLSGAFGNPEEERQLQAAISRQYPDHYLGSVPVLLGSDICKHPDDMTRTHVTLINAYVHGPLASTLFKAEDTLRAKYGWKRWLLIGHQSGGVARVSKTRAVDTIESGPVMGLYASAHFARRQKHAQVIALDVGGTTTKISFIENGVPALNRQPDVFGLSLKMPVPDVSSIALGGGSVARAQDGKVTLGPESMGAYPGPACYDLGGMDATFTDAALVLGYLNPDNFLGGARSLNSERARAAIQTHAADPLGCSVEEAAARIVQRAIGMVAEGIQRRLKATGGSAPGYTLFAYGGNGPMFAAGLAEQLGLRSAYVFDLGPVFSVLGSSLADILHVYEHALMVKADDAGLAKLDQALAAMRAEAARDLAGEELDLAKAQFTLDLDVRQPSGEIATASLPVGDGLDRAAAKKAIGKGTLELARLRATYPVGGREPEALALGNADASAARLGSRNVRWNGKAVETPIYQWESLKPGHRVSGPAVVESAHTTYLVGPAWQMQTDEFGNGKLTRQEK